MEKFLGTSSLVSYPIECVLHGQMEEYEEYVIMRGERGAHHEHSGPCGLRDPLYTGVRTFIFLAQVLHPPYRSFPPPEHITQSRPNPQRAVLFL